MKHSHYFKSVKHLDYIDVYRVIDLYNVTDPCIAHALKKLLCAGERGAKSLDTDVQEVIDTLHRWQEMQIENMKGNEPDPAHAYVKPLKVELDMVSRVFPWQQPDNMDYCDGEAYDLHGDLSHDDSWRTASTPCEHKSWHYYQSTHTKVCQNPECKHTEAWHGE